MRWLLCALWICVVARQVTSWIPGVTKGQVWPLPRFITQKETFSLINPRTFHFKITGQSCDIIEEAIKRYTKVIQETNGEADKGECACENQCLEFAEVNLTQPCEQWPHLHMDEYYKSEVDSKDTKKAEVVSSSVWGILRGLETFSQIVIPSTKSHCLMINDSTVEDYPLFPHRGLLLDTSRHYLPVPVIHNILSAMEINKMNVFHWHIVDDQSFPYQSKTFPSLSDKGAYDPKKLIYNHTAVKSIIEYARLRGIRVIPEFDSPGHTESWGKGVDKLLTPCYSNGSFDGTFGPVDPSRTQNYKFMESLFDEVKNVFPDKHIHIGGDEVDFSCWSSNPSIIEFMKEKHIKDFKRLESYYIERVLNVVNKASRSAIVWQEVFLNNDDLRNDTVVHIWTGDRAQLLYQVTANGKYALSSDGWYLDFLNLQWNDMYNVDLRHFNGTKKQKDLVLGGEACMWGEMVDETNIVPRIWPRASAVAERLWSSIESDGTAERLNEHVCRMKRRGVAAQPANGPGYCPY